MRLPNVTILEILQAIADTDPWETFRKYNSLGEIVTDYRCQFCKSVRGLPHVDECVWDNARLHLRPEMDRQILMNDFHGLALKWDEFRRQVDEFYEWVFGSRR